MKDRIIRVFVSSTFKDMKDERDELVKFVFPQLKKLCIERQVIWSEVDLRWGITDEQKAEGRVLPICLREIKKCRPYFIGILGERYGWIPREIETHVLEQEPWIEGNLGKSVTELEIMQGVLNDPEMADHAFFYFRAKEYIDTLPDEIKEDFSEAPSREEIQAMGFQKALELTIQRKIKLDKLKEQIRQSGYPVHENYPDPKAFGALVLRDFISLIDTLFPKDENPDETEREAQIHESYALSRCSCYIGGKTYFERLNNHVASDDPPLVITGESGTGKSSLLANWSSRFKENNPGHMIVVHFIGASALSADPVEMLKRIMKEMFRIAGIPSEIPSGGEEVLFGFGDCLRKVAEKGRCVLILDALNNLEDKGNAQGLNWLPEKIPSQIRLIISTLPGRSLDLLQKRQWPVFPILPFDINEKELFITTYLNQFSKSLTTRLTERIIQSPQTANPLFLQTLMEELRVYGDHQTLVEKCEHYLQANNPKELFRKLLDRFIKDYDRDRPGLVQETLCSIWASRQGLPESELLDIASGDGPKILRRQWSEFYIPAEHLFFMSSGRLNFSFDYFRQAVEDKFLAREYLKKEYHRRIAAYYLSSIKVSVTDPTTGEPVNDPERLAIAGKNIWIYLPEHFLREIAWQLYLAAEWNILYSLLSNATFNMVFHAYDWYENERYWTAIRENTENSFLSAYQNFHQTAAEYGMTVLDTIAAQAMHFDYPSLALEIQQMLLSNSKETSKGSGFIDRIKIAWNQHHLGNTKTALKQIEEVEAEARSAGDYSAMRLAIIDKGQMMHALDQFELAHPVFEEGERICREANDRFRLKNVLCSMGTNLNRMGKYDEALLKLKEAADLAKEFNDSVSQQLVLGELSNNALMRGEFESALDYVIKKEDICKSLGQSKSLGLAYMTHATILLKQENKLEALRYFTLAEEKLNEAGYLQGVAGAKMNMGTILSGMNLFAEAEPKIREAAKLFEQLGRELNQNRAFESLANLLNRTGRFGEALSITDILIISHTSSGNAENLESCAVLKLDILGNLFRFEELGNFHDRLRSELQESGQNQIIDGMGQFFSLEIAIAGIKEQHDKEMAARAENSNHGIVDSLAGQAWIVIVFDLKMYHLLAMIADEIETISNLPDCQEYLRAARYFKGWLLLQEGRLDESHDMMIEAFNLSYNAGDGVIFSWAAVGLAQLYLKISNLKEAQKCAEYSVEGFKHINFGTGLDLAQKTLDMINKKIGSGETLKDNAIENGQNTAEPEKETENKNETIEESWQKLFDLTALVPELESLRDADPQSRKNILWFINVLTQKGIEEQTKEAIQILINHFKSVNRIQDISPVMGLCGRILIEQGQIENALEFFREMEGICAGINYERGTASSWMNQGIVLSKMNNVRESLRFLDKSAGIFEKINDKVNLSVNYREQFKLFKGTGETAKAIDICEKREKLLEGSGEKEKLADAYNDHGCLLSDLGNISEAFEFHAKALKLSQSVNDKEGYQIAIGNMANCLGENNQAEDAIRLLGVKEAICREINNQEELAASFGYRASIYLKQNDFEHAIEYYEKEEAICREIGAEFRLQVSVGNRGTALAMQGRMKEAYPLFREKEAICRRLNLTYGLIISLMNIAACYMDDENYREAQSFAKEGLELIQKTGYNQFIKNFENLIAECKERASLKPGQQTRPSAKPNTSEEIFGELPDNTTQYFNNQPDTPDYFEQLTSLQNEENKIRGKKNNQMEYQENISEQAYVLAKLERYKEALRKYELCADLCARNGFHEAYIDCLLSQVELLTDHLDNPISAKRMLQEAILIAREQGLTQLEKEANLMMNDLNDREPG